MKKIISTIAVISSSYFAFSQTLGFKNDRTNLEAVNLLDQGPPTENLGLIPEPFSIDYSSFQFTNSSRLVLPQVFDMRLTQGITSVKNQGSCGSCWLFPSMGAVESRWKRLGLGDFDLSEDNLKHCHGFSYAPCAGGNRLMSTAYFTRGKGPISEIQDPYTAASAPDCPVGIKPEGNVTEAWFLPNKSVSDIKNALYNYGAVYNTFFWDKKYYNSTTKVYCQTRDTILANNHAVLIVGWNDTINTPLGRGAWIIKNSWGPSWGDAGFFYMSYNDVKGSKDPTIWVNRSNYNPKQITHGYDELGWTNSVGGAKTSYGLVKFKADRNQKINQIATYATNPNTIISAEIYKNFNGSSLSGLIATVNTTQFQYAGYYTLNLVNSVNITANDSFYVKYKVVNTVSNFPLAAEGKIANYTDAVNLENNKCWISTNGSSWTSIGANKTIKQDLSFKVIAEELCPTINATIAKTLVNLCAGGTTTLAITNPNISNTFQWQQSLNNGSTWSSLIDSRNYIGASTPNLIVKSATISGFDNILYRCVVTNACNFVISNTVKLRVTGVPVVINNPTNAITNVNNLVSFNVTVANPTNCMYQWQINNSGTTWTDITNNADISGANTNEIIMKALPSIIGKNIRCRLKSSCSNSYRYSSIVTIRSRVQQAPTPPSFTVQSDNDNKDFSVYPNPAQDILNFNFDEYSQPLIAKVYNINGQEVKSFEVNNITTQFDVTQLEKGIYFIRFYDNSIIYKSKFIKN